MKCVISVDRKHIKRVTNEEASELYGEGWNYIPKSVWKEKVRDIEKEKEVNKETGKTEMVTKKSNKMSKSAKRHMRKSK